MGRRWGRGGIPAIALPFGTEALAQRYSMWPFHPHSRKDTFFQFSPWRNPELAFCRLFLGDFKEKASIIFYDAAFRFFQRRSYLFPRPVGVRNGFGRIYTL